MPERRHSGRLAPPDLSAAIPRQLVRAEPQHGVDLADVALSLQLPITGTRREKREVEAAHRDRTYPGPVLCVAKVRAESLPVALPPKDACLKDRFRQALGLQNRAASSMSQWSG